jgi:DNA ligase (NAD+)
MKRSGQVIPFVISVTKKVTPHIPTKCPACGGKVEWNDNHIELVCMNENCDAKKLAQLISFFDILEVENAGEGIITALYEAGYTTVNKVLSMKKKDFEKLDKFGERKAEIVFTSIHDKMKGVTFSKLQHATGFFGSLGSRKLKLVEGFTTQYLSTGNIQVSEIMETDGFAKKSTDDFVNGLPLFRDFLEENPLITIKEEEKPLTDKYAGMSFVFTGFRSKEHEATITKNGGKMSESVSKTTTYLIMKEKGSGSSKETKALKAGVKVMDLKEFEAFLKG